MKSVNVELPIGSIVLWYGNAANVPLGWQICDGTNGTPNMGNHLAKGCDVDGNLNTNGGIFSHWHFLNPGTGIQAGNDFSSWVPMVSNESSFTKVYYIMKL